MGAVLRLMLTYRKVARMLPLVPGYKLAFGKRVGYLEDWLAHPAAAIGLGTAARRSGHQLAAAGPPARRLV